MSGVDRLMKLLKQLEVDLEEPAPEVRFGLEANLGEPLQPGHPIAGARDRDCISRFLTT